jgi:hypothetical protein
MDMYEILVLSQVFLFGWVSCHFYIAYKIRKTMKKIAEDNGMNFEDLVQTLSDDEKVSKSVIKVPNLFTEFTKNSILLYNKDTGKFLAQGETLEELADMVYKFNNIKFAYVNHNENKVWFVEGKVRNDLKELE